MCDDRTAEEAEEYLQRSELTRRQFGALSVASSLLMLLPAAANAVDVIDSEVNIETPDGDADCYFVHPVAGAHPAVLVWPDALGLRPAFKAMGKGLAESGYSVLVVNPYYRRAKAPVLPDGASFQDPRTREVLNPLTQSLNAATHVTDARAFIGWLDARPNVDRNRKVGTIGYCMGGPITMRTAASLPDRVGAGASFHGGGLVTDRPDSPHLAIAQMKAAYLFAIAANDDQREPNTKHTLVDAYSKAGLDAEVEVYEGTMHGWCPPDSAVYNATQAGRAWSRLLALFDKSLS